jgi:diguanylate cyclase (GGDEF)-like protein
MTYAIDQLDSRIVGTPVHARLRRPRAAVPPVEDNPALLKWALSVTAAAEQRIAELEARLAYLEGLSTTDELTCVLNRRGFLYEFARAIAATRRGGPTGAIIIGDLDGFKAVNDQLGHAGGNEVLRQVAGLLKRRVRKMDAVGRLGGDEFALLLIGVDQTIAHQKCQTLSRAFANSPPCLDGRAVKLGASFGVAIFDGSENEEEVLHRADMAMYAQKRRLSSGPAGAKTA